MKNYRLGLYEKAMPSGFDIRQKLECVKKNGFDFMEMSIDETDEKLSRLHWSKEQISDTVNDIRQTGIPISTICLRGHRKYPIGSANQETCKRGMDILRQAIQLANELGVRIIQLPGYDVYYELSTPDTAATFAKNLLLGVKFASIYGVALAFETMETEFFDTIGKALNYVKHVN